MARVSVLVHSGGNTSVLEGHGGGKPVEHNPIAISALDKLGHHLSCVGQLVHIDGNGSFHRIKMLPCIVEVVPGRSISHTADECGPFAFEVKLAAVKRMLGGFENSGAFIPFWRSKLIVC